MNRLSHNFAAASLVVSAIIAPASSAFAGASQWAEDFGGRMRVIVSAPESDGTIKAALQVEPDDGFITYWREPGESGIPPQITVSGTKGVKLQAIEFPVPKRLQVADMTDMGYDGPVTFPLILNAEPGAIPAIEVNAFVGLCKDICIPFQANFDFPANTASYAETPVEKAILALALTRLPEKPTDDFRVESARKTQDGIRISLYLPGDAAKSEITLANSKGFIVEASAGITEGGRYSINVPLSDLPENADPLDGEWLILAKSNGRAMEAPLVITPERP